jgi:hypothetical protein
VHGHGRLLGDDPERPDGDRDVRGHGDRDGNGNGDSHGYGYCHGHSDAHAHAHSNCQRDADSNTGVWAADPPAIPGCVTNAKRHGRADSSDSNRRSVSTVTGGDIHAHSGRHANAGPDRHTGRGDADANAGRHARADVDSAADRDTSPRPDGRPADASTGFDPVTCAGTVRVRGSTIR